MDPAKLKVIELRAELQARGLDIKGIKAVLVERLREALEEESGQGMWIQCYPLYTSHHSSLVLIYSVLDLRLSKRNWNFMLILMHVGQCFIWFHCPRLWY